MRTTHTYHNHSESMAAGRGHGSFAQSRMRNFGVTMAVMGASFVLYYLGFFGGVSGPLQGASIGDWLANLGFKPRHLLGMFLMLTVLSIIWNWVYNGLNRLFKWNLRCAAPLNDSGGLCSEPVVERTGYDAGQQYVCRAGHTCGQAQVRAVGKGTIGHFLWMMFLIFSVIVYYHMA